MPTIEELIAAPPTSHGVLIAGPGAGKSYNIGRRVDSLAAQGVQHDEIVLLTLTNETARTLRGRFPAVPVRTVHAYTLTALNRLGAAAGKRVADRWETKELVSRDVQARANRGEASFALPAIRRFLRKMGMGFRDEQESEAELTNEERAIWGAWMEVRDFLALRVFEEFAPDLIAQLQEGRELPDPPRALVVDEYQDLTPVELELVQTLSSTTGAGVFACGDDRQSIYGFRGADPVALNRFSSIYGTDGPAFLAQSRRCPRSVVELAEAVADRMPDIAGFAARPRMTSHKDRGEGETRILTMPSLVSEARWIARDIRRRRDEDSEKSIAVIVARDLGVYTAALNEASAQHEFNTTYSDSRTPLEIGERREFRFAYAILRIAEDPEDQLAWRTILHVSFGIGPDRIAALYEQEANRLLTAIRARKDLDGTLGDLYETVSRASKEVALAETVEGATRVIEEAADRLRAGHPDWTGLGELADEPLPADDAQDDDSKQAPWRQLLRAGRKAVQTVAADRKPGPDEVLVYTVHAGKGQEWDHVYLAGCYEQGYLDRGGPPGEGTRRLYVAITRSCISLTISKPRYTIGPPLEDVLRDRSPAFPRALLDAARAVGTTVEALPTQS